MHGQKAFWLICFSNNKLEKKRLPKRVTFVLIRPCILKISKILRFHCYSFCLIKSNDKEGVYKALVFLVSIKFISR
jgi:hypothetical protein